VVYRAESQSRLVAAIAVLLVVVSPSRSPCRPTQSSFPPSPGVSLFLPLQLSVSLAVFFPPPFSLSLTLPPSHTVSQFPSFSRSQPQTNRR
jgi:hypothetical protein